MAEFLTTQDVQNILKVDRSTIYRMIEAKQISAIKVGKQWRFPADQVESWLQQAAGEYQDVQPNEPLWSTKDVVQSSIETAIPLTCIRLIQSAFADVLGVMMAITDMQGNPVTEISHPFGLFDVVRQTPIAYQKWLEDWTSLGSVLDFEPQFVANKLGLLQARGLIRIGVELKGMVIIDGIAPDAWPPSPNEVTSRAAHYGLPLDMLTPQLNEIIFLDQSQRSLLLSMVQRIADILAHIAIEQSALTGKLTAIAELVVS